MGSLGRVFSFRFLVASIASVFQGVYHVLCRLHMGCDQGYAHVLFAAVDYKVGLFMLGRGRREVLQLGG